MIRGLDSKDLDGFTELRRAAVTDNPGESAPVENAAAVGLLGALGFEEFGVEPRARKVDGRYLDQVMLRLEL